jgi:rhodanese-related sulfurtransferase
MFSFGCTEQKKAGQNTPEHKQAKECENAPQGKPLRVNNRFILSILTKEKQFVDIYWGNRCFKLNETLTLSELNNAEFAQVQVKNIETVNWDALDEDTVATYDRVMKWWRIGEKKRDKILRLSFALTPGSQKFWPFKFSRVKVPIFYHTKVVDAAEARQLIQDTGILVIDPRSPKEFKEWHLDNAVNLPIIKDKTARNRFKWSRPPRVSELSGKKNIFVYGNDPLDGRARAALEYLLKASPSTEFLWFYGGKTEWNNILTVVPSEGLSVGIVDHKSVLKLLGKPHTAVDVRSKHYIKTKGKLPGAIGMRYKEGNLLRSAQLNTQALAKAKDTFNYKKDEIRKSLPILVYGRDEADWDAYKAAIWLKGLHPESQVYYFREGYAAWRAANKLWPDEYKIQIK